MSVDIAVEATAAVTSSVITTAPRFTRKPLACVVIFIPLQSLDNA